MLSSDGALNLSRAPGNLSLTMNNCEIVCSDMAILPSFCDVCRRLHYDEDAGPMVGCHSCDRPLCPEVDHSCVACAREFCDRCCQACQNQGCDTVACYGCLDQHANACNSLHYGDLRPSASICG